MSIVVARRKRAALYLSITGLLVMVAAVSAVSARDPSGVWLRVGMVMMTVGAALWLPWQALVPAAIAVWFVPNVGRSAFDGMDLFNLNMMLELPGMVGLGALAGLARQSLRALEQENLLIGATSEQYTGIDPDTGVYEERLLMPAISAELARSQRFGHQFALLLVGIDELRQRFDYRDDEEWHRAVVATAGILRGTRAQIDRVYRYGLTGFALLLPESGEREVRGLIRRLRRNSRRNQPAEGEPGGPLPTHFGATFFPQAATTVEDLLRRAEIALRLAEKTANRTQLDGAEAPALPSPEELRQPELEALPVEDETEAEPVAAAPEPSGLSMLGQANWDISRRHVQAAVTSSEADEPIDEEMPPTMPEPAISSISAKTEDESMTWAESDGALRVEARGRPSEMSEPSMVAELPLSASDAAGDEESATEAAPADASLQEAATKLTLLPPEHARRLDETHASLEALAAELLQTPADARAELTVVLAPSEAEEQVAQAEEAVEFVAEVEPTEVEPLQAEPVEAEPLVALSDKVVNIEARKESMTQALDDEAISDLFKRLDETLDRIRTLKSAS